MEVVTLKGGSLNSTSLHIDGNRKFVRKIISRDANREYGYVRWYSQLKKLQRYNSLFPECVPKLYDAGTTDSGAYFDIEYIPGKDIKTWLKEESLSPSQILTMHKALWSSFDRLHNHTYDPMPSSLMLYFEEEVSQKLSDARQFGEFDQFYHVDSFVHLGQTVSGMRHKFEQFRSLFKRNITTESYVHGNPTLENIMYDPSTNKITFIDLYEEGIVDSKFMDISQVLQCSNSYYGILNDSRIVVSENNTASSAVVPKSLTYFNQLFNAEMANRYTTDEIALINLFEATQFFRMLPFKCHAGNIDAAKFFYAHACSLVNKLL